MEGEEIIMEAEFGAAGKDPKPPTPASEMKSAPSSRASSKPPTPGPSRGK